MDAFPTSQGYVSHPVGQRPAIRLKDTQRRPSQMGELINSKQNATIASKAFCERVMQRTQARMQSPEGPDEKFIFRALELADSWPDVPPREAAAGAAAVGLPPIAENPQPGNNDPRRAFDNPGRKQPHWAREGVHKTVKLRTGIDMSYTGV